MQSENIRNRFLEFFKKRGHKIINGVSLVPKDDPSVLFTTAGMQPLIPYLLGKKHSKGSRLASVQKCVRMQDIEEVGDSTHDTFFEMLGNWSLGDYFKKDAIKWSYEFLTSKEEGLGLDPSRIFVTVFGGNKIIPSKDIESFELWRGLGIPEERIYFMEGNTNWWSSGDSGPCGTDTEMFYDVCGGLNLKNKEEFIKADSEQKIVEIWNDVFIEYEKKDGKIIGKLPQKNVDTGAGLERLAMATQDKDNIFETDLFVPIMSELDKLAKKTNKLSDDISVLKAKRIIADHIRTAVFIIADEVIPSNTGRGYILRRLIRRSVRYMDVLNISDVSMALIVDVVIKKYKETHPYLNEKHTEIKKEIKKEEGRFRATLQKGLNELEKINKENISGEEAFRLFSTYGFPVEMTLEIASENKQVVDIDAFDKEMKKHQEKSRAGAKQKFKGGLIDTDPHTTKLHTCAHLMLAGLRKNLGEHISQAGSNINKDRIRFDVTHYEKIDRDILNKVEDYVNKAIEENCDILMEQIKKEDAKNSGVLGCFWEKYPDIIDVYTKKTEKGMVYSKEVCGGPHIKNTREIKGKFKIKKESASSAGVRRIKCELEYI